MLSALSDYSTCERNSEKAYWNLAEAVAAIDLDFTRPFLPDSLAFVNDLSFLDDGEKLFLNQVHGHAYAHLFSFVEEFIIAEIHLLAQEHLYGDRTALRALLRFCEEEVKHQKLFEAFKDAFEADFPVTCEVLTDREGVARTVTQASPLAVMLLISLLEWITQKHYLSCFREDSRGVDPSFEELFRLHWVEEAQHAKLDSIEIDRLAEGLDEAGRVAAVREFLALTETLDGLLQVQAGLIADTFRKLLTRELTETDWQRLRDAQWQGLRWTFLGCGMDHPVFVKIVRDLAPGFDDELEMLAAQYGRG